jgi:predicted nuclease with TOPRIM domain
MIAEFTAAMSAIKETATLAKVISDAKTEAEKNAAVSDMVSKLTSVQRECMSLIELARSYQEETVTLKAKITEFEDFKAQTEGYVLNQLDSGSLVYSKKQIVGESEIKVHLCPQCYSKRIVAILQPMSVHWGAIYSQCFCPQCKNEYKMNKLPPVQKKIPPPSSRLPY